MARSRRHLLGKRGRAACGLPDPRHYTTTPSEVTCVKCQGTFEMAEAEVRQFLGIEKRP